MSFTSKLLSHGSFYCMLVLHFVTWLWALLNFSSGEALVSAIRHNIGLRH